MMRSLIDRLEQHTNAVYWSDGLLDLLAGVGLTLIGISWTRELFVLGVIAPALLIPLWSALRRRVVEPRRGYLVLGEQRQHDQRRLSFGLLGAGVGSLALGLVAYMVGVDSAMLVRAAPGALIGIATLGIGAALELRRFAIYALALVGVGVGSGLLGFNPGWAFITGGGLALAIGLGLLVRFLRRYPLVSAGAEAQ